MIVKIVLLFILVAALGAVLGNIQRKNVEGYYYKVGMAHQFMPGTMSNPEAGTVNCNRCDKSNSCYGY